MTRELERSELAEVLSHLFYEADMFFAMPKTYTGNPDRHIKNATLESFSIHMRNLAGFFGLGGPNFASDISIGDLTGFLPSWKTPELSQPDAEFMKIQIVRANKQVAHLTEERLTHRNPVWEWEYGRITGILLPYWRSFEQTIDADLPNVRAEVEKFSSNPKGQSPAAGATMCSSAPPIAHLIKG